MQKLIIKMDLPPAIPFTPGSYVIVAHALTLTDILKERGKTEEFKETKNNGERRPVYEGLLKKIRKTTIAPDEYIVKNGKTNNLNRRMNEHANGHFKGMTYAFVYGVFPC